MDRVAFVAVLVVAVVVVAVVAAAPFVPDQVRL